MHVAALGTLACASSQFVPLWRALPTRDGHQCIELIGSMASAASSVEPPAVELPQVDEPSPQSTGSPREWPLEHSPLASRDKVVTSQAATPVSTLLAEAAHERAAELTAESVQVVVPRRNPARGAESPSPADQPRLESSTAPTVPRQSAAAALPAEVVETDRTKAEQASQISQAQPTTRRAEGTESEPVPRALFNPPPDYPAAALRAGIEGRVIVRVELTGDGRVSAAAVRTSSGHAALDAAALEAVRRWRFEPVGEAPSKPVRDRVLAVPVRFTIEK